MEEQPNDQEQKPVPESPSEPENSVTNEPKTTASTQEPETKSPKKSKKWPWFTLAIILVAAASAFGWWFLIEKDETNQQTSDSGNSQVAEEENKQFNNVLYYAYYENGKTYVKSVDLNDKSAEKKTILELSEDRIKSYQEAPVSISEDGEKILYIDDSGVYEQELDSGNRVSIFRFEKTTDQVGDTILDKVIVTATGENIREVSNQNIFFRVMSSPVYSYSKNAIGYGELHYEGASVAVFDRDTNSTVDLGDTFTYTQVATAGALEFNVNGETVELRDYGLFPGYLFEANGGLISQAVFNSDNTKAAATVNLYDPSIDSTNYDSTTLVVIDTTSAEHQVVREIGKNSYELVYQSNGDLTVVDSGVNSFTIRRFDGQLKEISAQDLAKLSGLRGDVVSVDLRLVNDKVYVEITTKADETYQTFIYSYDDREFITEFLIAQDGDVKVLKHE